ncbi:MAG: hypothetical protein EON93_01050 [Burkholderiales bacterium]|nr:MAG: hypothetical protein EON93_01050 [Burkholderiales bacterium]
MAGYQFAHIASHSRKGNDRPYSSVSDVTAEAARIPEACPHVSNPKPPNILFGVAPDTIPAILEQRIALAKARSHGKSMRPIRVDTHVMESQVHSHPAYINPPPSDVANPSAAWLGEAACAADYTQWKALTLDFILWDAERRGLEVLSIVEHLDESHPHIHAYLAPNNARHDAKSTHLGHIAARRAAKEGASKKFQDIAYAEAMRSWQDDVYFRIGRPCGLTRFGPGVDRLTREEWHRRKHESALLKETQLQADATRAEGKTAEDALARTLDSIDDGVRQRENLRVAIRGATTEVETLKGEAADLEQSKEQLASEIAALEDRRKSSEREVDQRQRQLAELARATAAEEAKASAAQQRSRQAERERSERAIEHDAQMAEREGVVVRLEEEANIRSLAAAAAAEAASVKRAAILAQREHDLEAQRRLIETQSVQVELVGRAVTDSALAIVEDGSVRGFSMDERAMNDRETQAYRAIWTDTLKDFARRVARAVASLKARLEKLVQGETKLSQEQGALQKQRADYSRSMAILRGNQDRLREDVESLAKQRSALAPVVEGAANFETAWTAIPLDQRVPSVAEALNKASLLQQAAGIDGVFSDPARSKKPEGEGPSSRVERPDLDSGRE